ncbi:hypothetical protein [Marinicellulosiphila megalodicopiae]|uniref:hypothetical protein n=1 Tax=Marinicellulosiphila megalodicopiae TaxID=2724896 RepID=UPI003BB19955
MHIFKIKENGKPDNGEQLILSHQRSCDPVIAKNGYAYVTLRSSAVGCFIGSNELQIIDISQIKLPQYVGSIQMDGPKGLSFSNDGSAILICDRDSLKIFSISDPVYPIEMNEYETVKCNDIVELDHHYIITGDELLSIYSYNPQDFSLTFETDLLAL